jgi:hypothetical protein
MSKSKPYFPPTEAKQVVWLGNVKLKILDYLTVLVITTIEHGLIDLTNDAFSALVSFINSLNTYSVAMTEYKHRLMSGKTGEALGIAPVAPVPPVIDITTICGLFNRLFLLIANIKTRSGYTPDIGKALGIIGTPIEFDWLHFHANLVGVALYNSVQLSFTKQHLDGINIYSRLPGATEFTLLKYVSISPYLDIRPLLDPHILEKREYYAIGVVGDVEMGFPSPTITVVFSGPIV